MKRYLLLLVILYSGLAYAQTQNDITVIPNNTRFNQRMRVETRTKDRNPDPGHPGAIWFNLTDKKFRGDLGDSVFDFGTGGGGSVLPTNCIDSQVVKWSFAGQAWVCANDETAVPGSGITSLNNQNNSTQLFNNDLNVTISSNNGVHQLGWSGVLSISRGGLNNSATPNNGQVPAYNIATDRYEPFTLPVYGDASTNTNVSVDNEVALFSSTSGKILKRSALTAAVAKFTAGVVGAATYSDVVGLWNTCTSGYLKYNGTCDTPPGATPGGSVNDIQVNNGSGGFLGGRGSISSGGILTANGFVGPLTGNVTGNTSGTAATITGALARANTPLTTKGDLLVTDGSSLHRLGIGGNGTIPVADSSQTDGIKWDGSVLPVYCSDGGANDSYTCTTTPLVTTYPRLIVFKPNTNNTGGATLTIDSLATVNIVRSNNGTLNDNDLASGSLYSLYYDGTNYRMSQDIQQSGGTGITSLGSQTGATQTFGNDTNITITSSNDNHQLGWSGVLGIARGGLNNSATPSNGQVPTYSTANARYEPTTPTVYGDASTNTGTSVDSEIALFSGTGGKTLKRSALTAAVMKATSGIASAAAVADIVGLWTSCTSGYLKFDGTCSTPAGSPGGSSNDIQVNNGSGGFAGGRGSIDGSGNATITGNLSVGTCTTNCWSIDPSGVTGTGNKMVAVNGTTYPVQALSRPANQFVTGLGTDGILTHAQPSTSDLSDNSTLVKNSVVNTFGSGGSIDLSGSTVSNASRVPVGAGLTLTANGAIGYDSTNNMLHAAQGSADAKVPQFTITPTNGNIATWVVSGGNYKLGAVTNNFLTTETDPVVKAINGIVKSNTTTISAASAGTDYVAPGSITTDGITMNTARILGRTTASSGAVEELSALPDSFLSMNTKKRGISLSVGDKDASAALTTSATDYITVPFTCTISAYNLLIDAADSTFRVKFWKVATGTAKPTVSNVINTNGVGVPSGDAIHSTTVTDFDYSGCTPNCKVVSANDMIAMNVSIANTVKYINAVLQCDE